MTLTSQVDYSLTGFWKHFKDKKKMLSDVFVCSDLQGLLSPMPEILQKINKFEVVLSRHRHTHSHKTNGFLDVSRLLFHQICNGLIRYAGLPA